jgi:hypothetical protein
MLQELAMISVTISPRAKMPPWAAAVHTCLELLAPKAVCELSSGICTIGGMKKPVMADGSNGEIPLSSMVSISGISTTLLGMMRECLLYPFSSSQKLTSEHSTDLP